MIFGLAIFPAVIFFSLQATACELNVSKTEFPLNQKQHQDNLCLEDYFANRDMANFSLGEEEKTGLIFVYPDTTQIYFNDMILLSRADHEEVPLGEAGRVSLLKSIYSTFLASLKNENGKCELKIFSRRFSDQKRQELSISEFTLSERKEAHPNPGNRLMLTKDDVNQPGWELHCPRPNGKNFLKKSGNYFFIFMDVFENTDPRNLKDHLAKFLFAFR